MIRSMGGLIEEQTHLSKVFLFFFLNLFYIFKQYLLFYQEVGGDQS
jgi:hypothetical protein